MIRFILSLHFLSLLLFIIAFAPRLMILTKSEVVVDELLWMQRGNIIEEGIKERNLEKLSAGWWVTNIARGIAIPTAVSVAITNTISGQNITKIRDPDSYLFITRLAPAILTALFIPFIFVILSREGILEKVPAFFFAAIFALDPYFTSMSGWIMMDTYLTIFSFLALYSFYLWLQKGKTHCLVLTAFFASMAYLTKLPGLFLMILFGLILVWLLLQNAGQGRRNNFIARLIVSSERLIKHPMSMSRKNIFYSGVLLLTLFLGFSFIFWPRAWRFPLELFTYPVKSMKTAVTSPHENLNYFLGELTYGLPIYYYLVIIVLKLPWPILFGLIISVCHFIFRFTREKTHFFLLLTIFFSLLFLTGMSLAAKKGGMRYILPVLPFLYIGGFTGLMHLFKKKIKAIFGLLLAYQVVFLAYYYPEYYLYNNLFPFGNTIDKIIINDHGAGSTDALQYTVKKYGRRPIVYSYPVYGEYVSPGGKAAPYFSFQPLEYARRITEALYGKANQTVVVYQNHLLLRDAGGNREKLQKDFKKVYEVTYGNITTTTVWEEKK